jgi:hypothetical protein
VFLFVFIKTIGQLLNRDVVVSPSRPLGRATLDWRSDRVELGGLFLRGTLTSAGQNNCGDGRGRNKGHTGEVVRPPKLVNWSGGPNQRRLKHTHTTHTRRPAWTRNEADCSRATQRINHTHTRELRARFSISPPSN